MRLRKFNLWSREVTKVNVMETWVSGPDFRGMSKNRWLVRDLGDQPEMAMEFKGSIMQLSRTWSSCLSRLSSYLSWTWLLGTPIWLTRFRRQLLIMKNVRSLGSVYICAIISEGLRFAVWPHSSVTIREHKGWAPKVGGARNLNFRLVEYMLLLVVGWKVPI